MTNKKILLILAIMLFAVHVWAFGIGKSGVRVHKGLNIGDDGISLHSETTDYTGTYWGTAMTDYWTDAMSTVWTDTMDTEIPE